MKKSNERGEVVIEASIVVTLVVILISIMVYLGLVMYQRTLVTVMANQTASNIAQVYSNNLKDPFTGYINSEHMYQTVTFNTMKTDAYRDVIKQKAAAFASYRLASSSILTSEGTTVDIDIITKPGEILKCQVVVTVTDTFDIPLLGAMGIDNDSLKFSAMGRADCIDILEYVNGVEAIGDPDSSPIQSVTDHYLVTFIMDKYSGKFYATVPVLCGETMMSSNKYSHSAMPADPKFNGMKFTGWVIESGSHFSANTQVNENMTVYGTWECKVTLDPCGGSVSPKTIKVKYLSTVNLPIPSRNGYAFEGWYTEKEGAGERYHSNVTPIAGNVTLYAKWRCTHDFNATLVSEGTCVEPSIWKYTCVRCPYSYESYGQVGGHNKGSMIRVVEPTCYSEGKEMASCTRCSYVMEEKSIPRVGHNTNGRCGVTHVLGNSSFTMVDGGGNPVHAAGIGKTTKGECYFCSFCRRAGANGKWKKRNGTWVTSQMLCRAHEVNGGVANDNSYKNSKTVLPFNHDGDDGK